MYQQNLSSNTNFPENNNTRLQYFVLKVLTDHSVLFQNVSNRQLNIKDCSKTYSTQIYHYHSQSKRCSIIGLETYRTLNQPYLGIKTKNKIPVISNICFINIRLVTFKYMITLISPASAKLLNMTFNVTMSLTMKATTLECVAHKFSTNLYKHKHSPNKYKIFCLLSKWHK